MTYELKRQRKISEQLVLGDTTLDIVIEPEAVAMAYQTAQADLIRAQDALNAARKNGALAVTPDVTAKVGKAIVALFGVLFGEDNALKIIEFYEGNYTEMLVMVMPFIVDVVKPQLDRYITEMREAARTAYKKGKYGDKHNLGTRMGLGNMRAH